MNNWNTKLLGAKVGDVITVHGISLTVDTMHRNCFFLTTTDSDVQGYNNGRHLHDNYQNYIRHLRAGKEERALTYVVHGSLEHIFNVIKSGDYHIC